MINEDKSIYVTRGDIASISLTAKNKEDGSDYTFKKDDVVRFTVYGRKDAERVLLQKEIPILEDSAAVQVFLAEEDTRIGEVISKPTDYWYEVELNPDTYPQTIIGYDEEGPKIFRLYPEGNEGM